MYVWCDLQEKKTQLLNPRDNHMHHNQTHTHHTLLQKSTLYDTSEDDKCQPLYCAILLAVQGDNWLVLESKCLSYLHKTILTHECITSTNYQFLASFLSTVHIFLQWLIENSNSGNLVQQWVKITDSKGRKVICYAVVCIGKEHKIWNYHCHFRTRLSLKHTGQVTGNDMTLYMQITATVPMLLV
jgi:hypothetical protein